MPIYKGSTNQSFVYKGNSVIANVYKGSTLVYSLGFDPVTFTANSTWKVPPGIRQIRVDCVAAQGWSGTNCVGGYGGAGWYGGGGAVSGHYWAGSSANGSSEAAAGGGSSYTNPTLCSEVVHTQGYRAGSGYVTISMV